MVASSDVGENNSVRVVGVLTSVPVPVNSGPVIQRKSVNLSSSEDGNVATQVVVVEMTGCVTVMQPGAVDAHTLCNKVLPVVVAEKVPVDGLLVGNVPDVDAVVVKVVSRDQVKLGQVYARLGSIDEATVPNGNF